MNPLVIWRGLPASFRGLVIYALIGVGGYYAIGEVVHHHRDHQIMEVKYPGHAVTSAIVQQTRENAAKAEAEKAAKKATTPELPTNGGGK